MKQFNINTQQSQQRAFSTIASVLKKLSDEEDTFCNKDKTNYKEEDTFTCAYCDETFHIDYKQDASDGATVFEDNLSEYEAVRDVNNYPEFDERVR